MSFKHMSLERKLPLLVTALLVVILASAVGLAYREVQRVAIVAAVDRLGTASGQLASVAGTSLTQRAQTLRSAARIAAVRTAVNGGTLDTTAVHAALRRLVLPTDSLLAIQLWSASGTLVDSIGAAPEYGVNGTDTPLALARSVVVTPDSARSSSPERSRETARYGAFFPSKTQQTYYWLTYPVLADGHVAGWIAAQGHIATRPEATRQIAALIGERTGVYFRNDSGGFWTTLGGTPTRAPARDARSTVTLHGTTETALGYTRRGHGAVLASESAIEGTPWLIVLEVDRAAVLAGARALLMRFGAISLLLLALGAAVSFFIIRRVTRPLANLTEASESMATGDYSARVSMPIATDSHQEVTRLASAFNRMAEEVAAAHAKLAGQVDEATRLAAALEDSRLVAVSASRAKSNFLATISHELRTPINAIVGYTEILTLGIQGPLTAEQEESLGRVRTSAQHLLALVDEVLDLAKIESGTMQVARRPASTRETIDAAVAMVHPQATAKSVQLCVECTCRGSAMYVGDERGVRQILANLLSNALKFTGRGGEITLQCGETVAPSDSDHLEAGVRYVTIAVADTGAGIDPADLPRLFQPFTQLESNVGNPYTRSRTGAGLGLSISRELAHLMAGDITVRSKVGEGSTFTVWLPIAAA